MKIQLERIHDIPRGEPQALLAAGFNAYDPFPHLHLDVDWQAYEALQDAGALHVYTARENGALLGYAVFVVTPSPRRRYLLHAQEDVLHVVQGRAEVCWALVRHAERDLAARGVKIIYHALPAKAARFGRMLEHLGYPAIATVYAKLLEGE